MLKFLSLVTLLLFCMIGHGLAQESSVPKKNSLDEFKRARELAFAGNREEARRICYEILNENPEFYDAGILIGRTFAWDKNFKSGREELQKVLDLDFDNSDAIFAMIDLEKWAGDANKAVFYCEYGLSIFPNEEAFLVEKIKLLQDIGEEDKSLLVLDELLELNPGSEEGLALMDKYKSSRMIYKAVYQHDYEYFKEPYNRKWHLSSFQLARRNSWGTVIGKINLGDLIFDGESFWSGGVAKQFEIDAYPRVTKKSYAYLNYGYSPDNLFPKHRAGAELYHKLPEAFGFSAGMRFLQFDSDAGNKNIYIYTASLEKYYRNYWFSFRTYLTPKNGNVSQSYWLTTRRYLRDSKNYIGLELAAGVSPDEPRGNFLSPDMYKYKSRKVRLSYQDRLGTDRLLYLLKFGYEREEYRVNEKRNVLSFSVKLSYQF
ncbi:YaiO family outer membrane beta-barrel protein [Labilibaculum sp.]|uniref:YaiO family outer membrane beta-barrel protein n=1 Tax=Labilibaculum sp. TaxID=2060723 RepID=UPI002AA672BC|nr:YaiO family outer membrane beta-barrel protein [Labilibaculum sp.]